MNGVQGGTKFMRNHGDKICTHTICYLDGRHIIGDKDYACSRLLVDGSHADDELAGMIGVFTNNDLFVRNCLLLQDHTCEWTTGSAAEHRAVEVPAIQ